MGLAKISITRQLLGLGAVNTKLFGQIFLGLPEGTYLHNIAHSEYCVEFHVFHPYFKDGGEITALFNRTAFLGKPLDDIKYIEQFIGFNFDHAIEKL